MITLPSEIATSAGMFVFAIVQALILLAFAPLFSGISRMIRARIQSRRGPGVLQDYRDIAKLMKRQNIWPDNAGWVSKAMPYVLISTVMVVAMGLPLFTRVAPFGAGSDLITVIYLFALFRFRQVKWNFPHFNKHGEKCCNDSNHCCNWILPSIFGKRTTDNRKIG
jgi:NADH:ubiquinone oxidoreductase subunit H